MDKSHIEAIFEMWKIEFFKDEKTGNEILEAMKQDDYAEEAAKYFLELSERIIKSHLNTALEDTMPKQKELNK